MSKKGKVDNLILAEDRSRQSFRNGMVSASVSVLVLIISFFSRAVFIKMLSTEYLGLNGLFSNILSILTLSELGIGNAISYALYKPLKDGDTRKLQALMRMYRKLYIFVGFFILFAGVALTPFLSLLIKEKPRDIRHISVYFLLYVFNIAGSYFFSYKRTLLICCQKEYILSILVGVSKMATAAIQIVVLLVTKSYLLYLVVAIFLTLIENLLVSYKADQMFPDMYGRKPADKKKDEEDTSANELSTEEKQTIRTNVKAIFFHNIGGTLTYSTDNLIISKFLGLVKIGLYSNYTVITSAVNGVLSKLIISTTPSLGNLMVSSTKEHIEKTFYHVLFVNAWIYGFACNALMCLIQTFISLWIGKEFLLAGSVVILVVINTYINSLRLTVLVFKDAAGIFVQDKYKPLVEGVVNVLISIPLAIAFGISGVLIGTLVSILFISFWWESLVFFKETFGKGIREYLTKQLLYLGFNGCIICLCYYLCSFICGVIGGGSLLISFAIRLIICAIVPNLIYVIGFRRSDDYKYFMGIIRSVFKRKNM